jgi:hypothetical protein
MWSKWTNLSRWDVLRFAPGFVDADHHGVQKIPVESACELPGIVAEIEARESG